MSQINVNNIRAKDGVGAVGFPGGINATGVVTATSFLGNLTGNVTGTAGGLTGTPNITVGTVTGTDATFSGNVLLSGNLSVQGTTTTIDTVVTAVDTLAVDTKVAIGTNTYNTSDTVLQLNKNTSHAEVNIQSGNAHGALINFSDTDANGRGRIKYNHVDDSLSFRTAGTDRLFIDGNGTSKFKGPLTEKCNRDTGAGLTGDYNHDLITYGNVHWATSNSSGTWTYNLRGSATVALNDMMDDGETLSFQLISAQNSTSNYMTAFKIDGSSSHLVWWQGGSAPSAGGGSGYDVYTFTVFKIGNASFRTFASLSNHA
jgi:hypothetical protein